LLKKTVTAFAFLEFPLAIIAKGALGQIDHDDFLPVEWLIPVLKNGSLDRMRLSNDFRSYDSEK
jgi:hypothetical protein